jgi:UDP-perosamine 4-acetyltransferase
MISVIGLGAGGHARVVMETLQSLESYKVIGLLDPKQELWDTKVHGVPVLGDDHVLPALYDQGVRHAFIGVGSIGDTEPRRRLYERLCEQGFQLIHTIHPRAFLAPSVEIGHGTTILANAVVNTAAKLGANVIVNTGAIVEHDCRIEDHAHIASGVCLASTVHVGEGAHIGLGASIRQCIHIGRWAIVGAGAVVVNDVPDHTVVAGVPARVLRVPTTRT